MGTAARHSVRYLTAVVAVAICFAALAGSSRAAVITGISDQNMAPAPGLHSGWSATANDVFTQLGLPHLR